MISLTVDRNLRITIVSSLQPVNSSESYPLVIKHSVLEKWSIQISDFPINTSMWGFPELGVPPNHPLLDGIFREIDHPALGVTH